MGKSKRHEAHNHAGVGLKRGRWHHHHGPKQLDILSHRHAGTVSHDHWVVLPNDTYGEDTTYYSPADHSHG